MSAKLLASFLVLPFVAAVYKPASLKTTALSPSEIGLYWSVSGVSNSQIKDTRIESTATGASKIDTKYTTKYTIRGLKPDTSYRFRVSGHYQERDGSIGIFASSWVSQSTKKAVPKKITVSIGSIGSDFVRISWSVSGFSMGCGSYKASLCRVGTSTGCLRTSTLMSSTTFKGLKPFTEYEAQVTVDCSSGESQGSWSSDKKRGIVIVFVPTPRLNGTVVSSSEVQLEWNYEEVTDATGKRVLFKTEVIRDRNATLVDPRSLSLRVGTLEPGKEYEFAVRLTAPGSQAKSATSNVVKLTT